MFRATMCPSSGADDCVMLQPCVGMCRGCRKVVKSGWQVVRPYGRTTCQGIQKVTSSWFFLSTLNYDARSTTHQICTLFFIRQFTSIILDMFRTSNCSSSGGVLCKQLTVFHRAEIILKLYECMNCLDIDLVHRMSS